MKFILEKKSDLFIVILMTMTTVLFVWQKVGMNETLEVDLLAHSPYMFNDFDYGGTSEGTLSVENGHINLTCNTKATELTFPFCSIIVPLQPAESKRGVDLSRYSELHIKLAVNSSARDTVLIYLQNDEQSLTADQIIRANMSILTPENELELFKLPLSDFHLASWWIYEHLDVTNDIETNFQNVGRIQVATGDNRLPRQIKFSIHSIEFHGKWLNNLELYSLILSVWFIYFLAVITYKIINLSQSHTKAIKKSHTLESRNENLEQSVSAKDMFLANMSHEIRTPMNGIYGTLQLLKQKKPTGENKELINKALFSTRSLLRIINDILDFSKIESGKLEIESVAFNLADTLQTVVTNIEPIAKAKGISLKSSYAKNISKAWLGDPVRIEQILINLISNAIKFTESGEVSVAITCFTENRKKANQVIKIQVKDSGIGMSEDAIARLFERFEQADNSTTRQYGGTGLGMSITNSLVKLMHGEISVESKPNQGSKFIVLLPMTKTTMGDIIQPDKTVNQLPKVPNKTILIVEDNHVNLLIMNKMLKHSEATLLDAKNGIEAIAMIEEHNPDLILMDIQMPVMDGKEACKKLREAGVTTPIIAFTANVLEHETQEYLKVGFDGFLSKPVELTDVYSILEQYLLEN